MPKNLALLINIVIPSLERIAAMEDVPYLKSLLGAAVMNNIKLGVCIQALNDRLQTLTSKGDE